MTRTADRDLEGPAPAPAQASTWKDPVPVQSWVVKLVSDWSKTDHGKGLLRSGAGLPPTWDSCPCSEPPWPRLRTADCTRRARHDATLVRSWMPFELVTTLTSIPTSGRVCGGDAHAATSVCSHTRMQPRFRLRTQATGCQCTLNCE